MRNSKIIQMSLHALFLGLMALMTFIPQIGFISITPFIAFTLLHIPVLFGALLFGWQAGLIYGLAFGLMSFIRALIAPVGILDPYFVNPLISILPRTIFGLLAGLTFDFAKIIKNNIYNKLFLGVTSLALTLIHSVLVLVILGLIEGPAIDANPDFIGLGVGVYWTFMGLVILTNGIPEAILALILVPILALAVRRYPRFQLIADAFKKEKAHE